MPEPAQIAIRLAVGDADIAQVRALMQEYGDYLTQLTGTAAGAANICMAGYDEELDALPGPYAAPGGALLLAIVDGEPAGCVALKPMASRHGERPIEMKRLWVRTGCRGFSLGRKLVQAALNHAIALGASVAYLDTVPVAMPEANRLYESMGFTPVDRYNANAGPGVAYFKRSLP
jgi:GNAT superfamily N-acetyltransferase